VAETSPGWNSRGKLRAVGQSGNLAVSPGNEAVGHRGRISRRDLVFLASLLVEMQIGRELNNVVTKKWLRCGYYFWKLWWLLFFLSRNSN